MKIFFQMVPIELINNQIRLQLGIVPLVNMCLTLFLYTMYPQVVKKKVVYIFVIFLGFTFFIYGISNPFYLDNSEVTEQALVILQITYIAFVTPGIIYIALILIHIILRNLEGASYV